MGSDTQQQIQWWEAFLREANEQRQRFIEKGRPQSELDDNQRSIDQAKAKLAKLRNQ